MKWLALISVFILSIKISFSQRNYLNVGYQHNIDLWVPYGNGKPYQDTSNAITSNSWGLYILGEIISKQDWGINIGIVYRKLNYKIKDRIYSWNYPIYESPNLTPVDTIQITYNDPADLIANSKSIGGIIEGYYNLLVKEKLKISTGISTEIFFYENYYSTYQSSDFSKYNTDKHPQPANPPLTKWFLSSINSSIYFRSTWYFSSHFNIGGKISIGTNIYADWEQFKRYIWVGVGVEMGFGGSKRKEMMEQ